MESEKEVMHVHYVLRSDSDGERDAGKWWQPDSRRRAVLTNRSRCWLAFVRE